MNVGKSDCIWCGGKGFMLYGSALFKSVLTSFYEPCVCLLEEPWLTSSITDVAVSKS